MKVIIIGLGSIGKKHVKAIKTLYPKSEIFALRSKMDAENNPEVTNIYSLSEINSCDFALIANPTSEHKRTISQLLEYRFPMFIEKPIYCTLDIEDLVNSVIYQGIQTYVACNLRFLGCLNFIKENLPQLHNKRLNEVNIYCGSYLPDWRSNNDFKKRYSAIPELGGGVHLDLIHELDYVYWLFGTPKEIKRNFRSQSSLSVSSVDFANYLMDFNGFCVSVVLNYYRRDPKRILEMVFEDETWNIDLLNNQITCRDRIIYSSELRIGDTYKIQMDYFINCLKEKNSTFNTILDAYNVLKICLGQ